MTDSQSWPLDIPSMPELSAKGAYGLGLSYSPGDLAYIQQYAANRGIEVIIEIDMPGHIGSVVAPGAHCGVRCVPVLLVVC